MTNILDEILQSGCIEKLIESNKELSSKEELSAYLEESGFSEISDEDLETIFSQIKQINSSGGLVYYTVNKTKKGTNIGKTCDLNF